MNFILSQQLLSFHYCISLDPFCKFVTKKNPTGSSFNSTVPLLNLKENVPDVLLTLTFVLHKHRNPVNRSYLAGEMFGTSGKTFEKSALAGFQLLLSRTHQFASHSLPGGDVLSQVNFPK